MYHHHHHHHQLKILDPPLPRTWHHALMESLPQHVHCSCGPVQISGLIRPTLLSAALPSPILPSLQYYNVGHVIRPHIRPHARLQTDARLEGVLLLLFRHDTGFDTTPTALSTSRTPPRSGQRQKKEKEAPVMHVSASSPHIIGQHITSLATPTISTARPPTTSRGGALAPCPMHLN